jgi:hypothetical protein
MDGPTRPTPPSAIDGYRRLERTRKVAAGHVPVATAVVPPKRRAVNSARVAGMLRLAGFIAVLAVIVGTSVGLASADNRAGARRVAAEKSTTETSVAASASTTEAVSDKPSVSALAKDHPAPGDDAAEHSHAAASDDAPEAAEAPAVEESVAVAAADTTPAPAATAGTATTSLPFTGEPSLDRILLFGAGLVLLGMLVQIAGQPLPARARSRR